VPVLVALGRARSSVPELDRRGQLLHQGAAGVVDALAHVGHAEGARLPRARAAGGEDLEAPGAGVVDVPVEAHQQPRTGALVDRLLDCVEALGDVGDEVGEQAAGRAGQEGREREAGGEAGAADERGQ